MLAGLADFIERSPTLVGKMALPFLLVGGGLQLAINYGYVDPRAFDGTVGQTVPIIWVTGIALACLWLLGALMKLPEALRSSSSERRHGKQVRDNLRFLDEKARFLLLIIIVEQGGRCPSTGTQAFETLTAFGILELEMDFAGSFNSHGVYRVSKFIQNPQALARSLAERVSSNTNIDVSTSEGRKRYLQMYPQNR